MASDAPFKDKSKKDKSKKRKLEAVAAGSDEVPVQSKKSKKEKGDTVINGTNGHTETAVVDMIESPLPKKEKKSKKDRSEKKEKKDSCQKIEKKENKGKKEQKEKKEKKSKSDKSEVEVESAEPVSVEGRRIKKEKKSKKDKKSKPVKDEEQPDDAAAVKSESNTIPPVDTNGAQAEESETSAKRRAKKERQKAKKAAAYEAGETIEKAKPEERKNRFIVFVGNLPFNTTIAAMNKHFGKLQPKSIRLNQDKESGKCKGIAFVEFEDWDKMNTCIMLYHHSKFDDGEGGEKRKINIELSAGGGGTSDTRKAKIKEKNEKLHVKRQNEILKKKEGGDGAESRDVHDGMHPSRRAQIGV